MHEPNHNETISSILKFLDAERPAAPGDATRTEDPQGYMQDGEYVEPQPSSDPMWVGETVTDVLHYFGIKDKDLEVASQQKEALSNTIDFFSPQSLGGAGLMLATAPIAGVSKLLKGARRSAKAKQPFWHNRFLVYGDKTTDQVHRLGDKYPAITQAEGTSDFLGKSTFYRQTVTRRKKTADQLTDAERILVEESNYDYDKIPFSRGATTHKIDIYSTKDLYNKNRKSKGWLSFDLTDIKNADMSDDIYLAREMVNEAEILHDQVLKSPKLITNVHFFSAPGGSERHPALALKHVFDRFDDDWILKENNLTMDSFVTVIQQVLRKYGKEIEFNRKFQLDDIGQPVRNTYFSSRHGPLTKNIDSQEVFAEGGATILGVDEQKIPIGIEELGNPKFKEKLKQLIFGIEDSGKLVGEHGIQTRSEIIKGLPTGDAYDKLANSLTLDQAEDFWHSELSVTSNPFIIKSFKERLAAIFGVSVSEMSGLLEDLGGSDRTDMKDIDSLEKLNAR
jgi:hypothetical protein